MILTKGEKPLDVYALLKDVKTKTIVHYSNGFIKVVLEDKRGIEKLKEVGFIDAV